MMNAIRNLTRTYGIVLTLILLLASAGCKSKKKAMEAAAAEKARQEQEAALKKQQEEEAARKDAEEKARREAEANKETESQTKAKYSVLNQYFNSIATAGNLNSANSSIDEALTMFADPDTPVLIVISESGGQKDYDRPTTIRDYLNYLKDQKKNMNSVSNLQFNEAGKITEVELRKN